MVARKKVDKALYGRFVTEALELGFIVTSRLKTLLGANRVEQLIVKQLGPKRYVVFAVLKGSDSLVKLSTKREAKRARVFMSVEVVRRFIERNLGLRGKLLIEFSVDTNLYKFSG